MTGTSNTSGLEGTVWGDWKETSKNTKPLNRVKTLDCVGKKKENYTKQAKRWFKMNPNRTQAKLKISNTETILVFRKDIMNDKGR